MVKTISYLMFLSSAAIFFTACSSQKEPSVEDRLHSQYGWQGTLPKPAADADAGKDIQEQTPAPVVIVTMEQQPAAQTPKKDDGKPVADPIEKKLTKADLSGEKREHVIQKGESLWMLAVQEYGDGIYWRWIYEENTDVIKGNPNRIISGTKIRIPLLKKTPAAKPAPEKPAAKPAPAKPVAKAPAKPAAKPAPAKAPAKPAAKPAPAKPAEVPAKPAAK